SSGFAGTSAASPYIAGAAALVHQRYPSLTMAQLRDYLVAHSMDAGAPGVDNTFGAGDFFLPFIQYAVITYPSPSSSGITWHEATVSAVVDPKDSDTTVTFEYAAPGATAPTQASGGVVPAGAGPTTVSAKLSGLTPG